MKPELTIEHPKAFVPVAPAEIPAAPVEVTHTTPGQSPETTPAATDTPLATETRAHHPYSPSTLQSLEACALYTGKESKKEHARTTAGTRAHNSADTETDDERLSDEDAAAVADCLDYVAQLKQDFIKDAFSKREEARKLGCYAPPSAYEEQVSEVNEPYLPIDDIIYADAEFTTAGYADKIIFNHDETRAHVADYKFGMWPVTHARENLQGLAYALGVFKKWKKVQEVTIHFLQPLLDSRTTATIRRADIPEHYFRICAVVARARAAREAHAREIAQGLIPTYSAATPNAPTCSFCGHLGNCTKALDVAIKVAHKFSPLDIPDDITPSMIHSDKDTSTAMRLAMVVSTWAKAFKTCITNRVINGDAEIPEGFKLVSQAKRELVDMATYRKHAIKIIGAKAFEETLQTTFGAVEELVAEKAPRGMKKKIVLAFQKETEESGCVKRDLPITFLKAVPKKEAE